MRKIILVILLLTMTGCVCFLQKQETCNDEKYGPIAIRLSEMSSQVFYYYQGRKEPISADFNTETYFKILRQLPPYQANQKDVDTIASFDVQVRPIEGAFSIMLCEREKGKIMEDLAGRVTSGCKFDLNKVEIRSWNSAQACSFETDWGKYCTK